MLSPMTVLAVLTGLEPFDRPDAAEILLEVETNPDLYLTTGQACAGYEVLKDYVEGGACHG